MTITQIECSVLEIPLPAPLRPAWAPGRGLSQLRKMATLAEVAFKKFILHMWPNGIGLGANLHLAASLPNCPWFAFPVDSPSLADRVYLAQQLRQVAQEAGVFLAPIDRVYRGLAVGSIEPLSVPAFNLRGLTYDIARAIWRVVRRTQAGPVIFELARRLNQAARMEYDLAVLVQHGASTPGLDDLARLSEDLTDEQRFYQARWAF